MTTFERLAHHVNVTDAFEAVVNTTTGHLDQMVDHVLNLTWVNKVGHAKLTRQVGLRGVQINTNDSRGTDHTSALDHIKSNASQSKDSNGRTCFNFHRERDGANACRHTTADVADLIEGRVFSNLCNRNFG